MGPASFYYTLIALILSHDLFICYDFNKNSGLITTVGNGTLWGQEHELQDLFSGLTVGSLIVMVISGDVT